MLLFAWGPALLFGAAFLMYEQVPLLRPTVEKFTDWVAGEDAVPDAMGIGFGLGGLGQTFEGELDEKAIQSERQKKHRRTWNWLMTTMVAYSQTGFMIIIVGLAAPPLISSDLRTKALVIYFSRPVTRVQYLFGKAAVVWIFLLIATTLPALVVYIAAILLSPDLAMAAQTWDLPLRILAASAILLIPTTGLALAFSSLSSELRTPTFLWYGCWVIGAVAYFAVWSQRMINAAGELSPHWAMLSLYHTIARVDYWIFGLETSWLSVAPELALLAVIAIGSFGLAYYRVASATNA